MVHRDQLRELRVTAEFVRAQVNARRWTAHGENLVILQNSAPARRQLMWMAVLDAGELSALCCHTALELAGLRSSAAEAEQVHLVVPKGRHTTPIPGVAVHESRRFAAADIVRYAGLRCTDVPRSAIDAAAWQPWPRFACLMLSMVVQQRLCTPLALDAAMRTAGRVRHKQYMRLTIADLMGGAETLGEADVAKLCRNYGLEPPRRQVRRRDSTGSWRYLDCEWDLPSGEIVVLEVDGRHHFDVEHWEKDMRRERAVVVSGRRVLRATNFEVRADAASLAADLTAIGVPRRADLSARGRAIATGDADKSVRLGT